MPIKFLSVLFVVFSTASAAMCEGSGCKVEDEVSLLQTKIELDDSQLAKTQTKPKPIHELREEWETFKSDMDGAMAVEEEIEFSGKINRERGDKCGDTLKTAGKDICFLSGGRNPEVKGHEDQYDSNAWQNIFSGLPSDKCFYCGVAGKYKGVAEGTVMLSCDNKWSDLGKVCVSMGAKLQQDSILLRQGGHAKLVQTYPKDKVGHLMAQLNPVPEAPKGDFVSVVNKGGGVSFSPA